MISQIDPSVLRDLITENTSDFSENSVSFIFTCPRCKKSKKLYIRKRDGAFVCWRCAETEGFKGRAERALWELFGIPYGDSVPRLYGLDAEVPEGSFLEVELVGLWGEGDDPEDEGCGLPPTFWPLDSVPVDSPAFGPAERYLAGRGISRELAATYDLRWRPSERRVLIPVVVDGLLRGWQGRYIDRPEWEREDGTKVIVPKILSTEGLTGGGALMFQDRLRGSNHAVLTEGPFDALKAHLCGGNIASMGKAINTKQLDVLRSSGIERLYVAFDPDAGEEFSRVAFEMSHLDTYLMVPPDGKKDFGDCTLEETFEAYKKAERLKPSRLFVPVNLPVGVMRL